MYRKNPFRTNYSFFSSKVQNLTVFSIIYMIRIRFFGPEELFQKGGSGGTVHIHASTETPSDNFTLSSCNWSQMLMSILVLDTLKIYTSGYRELTTR